MVNNFVFVEVLGLTIVVDSQQPHVILFVYDEISHAYLPDLLHFIAQLELNRLLVILNDDHRYPVLDLLDNGHEDV